MTRYREVEVGESKWKRANEWLPNKIQRDGGQKIENGKVQMNDDYAFNKMC